MNDGSGKKCQNQNQNSESLSCLKFWLHGRIFAQVDPLISTGQGQWHAGGGKGHAAGSKWHARGQGHAKRFGAFEEP